MAGSVSNLCFLLCLSHCLGERAGDLQASRLWLAHLTRSKKLSPLRPGFPLNQELGCQCSPQDLRRGWDVPSDLCREAAPCPQVALSASCVDSATEEPAVFHATVTTGM